MNSREIAEKIIVVTGAEDLARQGMEAMIDQISEPIISDDPVLGQRVIPVIKEVFNSHYEQMAEITVGGYVKTFSQEELEGLLDFYESEIGVTFLSKMPQFMSYNLGETQAYTQAVILPDLEEKVLKVMDAYDKEQSEEE